MITIFSNMLLTNELKKHTSYAGLVNGRFGAQWLFPFASGA
jgi:hypothetical protein